MLNKVGVYGTGDYITGYTCSKEKGKMRNYFNGDTCVCGMAAQNTEHMLRCSLLSHSCTLDDLLKFNDIRNKSLMMMIEHFFSEEFLFIKFSKSIET